MNKKKKILIFGICVLVLILLIILFNLNKKETNKESDKVKENVSIKNMWYEPNGNSSSIEIYYQESYNNYVSVKEGQNKSFIDSTYKLINTYKCTVPSCNMYSFSNDTNKVIVKDDKYVLYDFNENKALKLNLPSATYNDIQILSYNGKDYGLSMSNINNMYAFYSLEKEEFTTEFKYSNIYISESDGLSKGYISTVINNDDSLKYYIINYKNDSIVFESDVYVGIIGNEENVYFYKNYADLVGVNAVIYNEDLNVLFDGENYEVFGVCESGNIALKDLDKETFSIYNKKGKKIKTSKTYKQILTMYEGYVVLIDEDNILKIVDHDGNVKADFDELTSDDMFNNELSKVYYDNDNLVINVYIEKIMEDRNVSLIKYYYVPETKEKGKISM